MAAPSEDSYRLSWDPVQRDVITEPPGSRLLVDAGPGTGKTAVACARIAWLIDHAQVEPNQIWLISFTRAAVHEVRKRIGHYLSDPDQSYSITIATLDSRAWAVHSGYDDRVRKRPFESYDEKITQFLARVNDNPELKAYLSHLNHLVIDEAQDFVGDRAELVLAMIRKLHWKCGVSIFADDAQAIYGFSIKKGRKDGDPTPLPARVRQDPNLKFKFMQLGTIHRTDSPNLKRIFSRTRERVVDLERNPSAGFEQVRTDLLYSANNRMNEFLPHMDLKVDADSFILYRKGVDVLFESETMGEIPHRIRIGGLPRCIQPWIGACLSGNDALIISRKVFSDRWKQVVEGTTIADIDLETAWDTLVSFAGTTDGRGVELKLLRNRFGRSAPPPEICIPDIGPGGPAIGTIHASKGREADTVYLYVDPENLNPSDPAEEARILFVGASRARKRLNVVESTNNHRSKTFNSRRYTTLKGPRVRIQIGLGEDINAAGVAGKQFYPDPESVTRSQNLLVELAGKITPAWGEADRQKRCYQIRSGVAPIRGHRTGDGGFLTVLCNSNTIEEILKIGKNKVGPSVLLPETMPRLRVMGLQTIVLPYGSQACPTLHEPWSQSGIMLAPIIVGFPELQFPGGHFLD